MRIMLDTNVLIAAVIFKSEVMNELRRIPCYLKNIIMN